MLESELYDRESHDNEAGGRDAGELNPAVPAAVFQPPPVVFQPPTARPEPERAARNPGPGGAPGPARKHRRKHPRSWRQRRKLRRR